ncbi:MAG: alanine racemase [Candidatus Lloydbacteria bacterium CG22_combo_CG10-13_8_21_14_all_47_15]|uniref:Alanine racemase n=1 Tax=Candidatus Lloydbacteria bacterium CG22_combo_CG10-13_8_21_14_all_47_15 TaxID=1974635 RepID=A0A2H0CTY7_9BACT|nr:MAG: alanine racemase [Candidatus Lloydbacteria bacterium CG22_combo_CG10-13_8_21_14_all_47_15]
MRWTNNSKDGLRTWAEVSTKALGKNYRLFRKIIPKKTALMAIAKSNAYGHGLVPFARAMESLGADWIGVDSFQEAVRLREEGIAMPILVLGHTLPERLADSARRDIRVTVSNMPVLHACATLPKTIKKKLRMHIKTDTGMGRQGFQPNELGVVLSFAEKNGLIDAMEGLYTHFAQAKNPSFRHTTQAQIQAFEKARAVFTRHGLSPLTHAAATSGTMIFPEAHYDMVRIGIGMYGLWPSKEARAALADKFPLIPVLSWKTLIGEVNHMPKGAGIGYDHTEKLTQNSFIAVCPVGYWHGYPRALSSIGRAIVRQKQARVLGRISMDMLVLDVTHIPNVRAGDEVTLIGASTGAEINADELAHLSDTVNYEIVTRINPLIRRIYI